MAVTVCHRQSHQHLMDSNHYQEPYQKLRNHNHQDSDAIVSCDHVNYASDFHPDDQDFYRLEVNVTIMHLLKRS